MYSGATLSSIGLLTLTRTEKKKEETEGTRGQESAETSIMVDENREPFIFEPFNPFVVVCFLCSLTSNWTVPWT